MEQRIRGRQPEPKVDLGQTKPTSVRLKAMPAGSAVVPAREHGEGESSATYGRPGFWPNETKPLSPTRSYRGGKWSQINSFHLDLARRRSPGAGPLRGRGNSRAGFWPRRSHFGQDEATGTKPCHAKALQTLLADRASGPPWQRPVWSNENHGPCPSSGSPSAQAIRSAPPAPRPVCTLRHARIKADSPLGRYRPKRRDRTKPHAATAIENIHAHQ